MRDRVETVGFIDRVHVSEGSVIVQGWVAGPPEGEAGIDSMSLRLGDADAAAVTTNGIPRPDVAAAHPHLRGALESGFEMRVPLGPGIARHDVPVEVTPWVRGRPGRSLFAVVEPSLPLPSERNVELVGGGFGVGFESLGHLIERVGLRPDERVLDVGCGTGRVAYALTYYLAPTARYDGFDIVEELIEWCRGTITPRHPNFRFHLADVHNDFYNPDGRARAWDYEFPYDDGSFDVAFAMSVFTHLLPDAVTNYLDEVCRVLRPGGRGLVTWFLLDEETGRLDTADETQLRFRYRIGEAWSAGAEVPEAVVAYDRRRVLEWLAIRGLEVEAVLPGWWAGRARYTSFQDIVVFRRR